MQARTDAARALHNKHKDAVHAVTNFRSEVEVALKETRIAAKPELRQVVHSLLSRQSCLRALVIRLGRKNKALRRRMRVLIKFRRRTLTKRRMYLIVSKVSEKIRIMGTHGDQAKLANVSYIDKLDVRDKDEVSRSQSVRCY